MITFDDTVGFTDARRGRGNEATCLTNPAYFHDRATMVAALQASDATTYSNAQCKKMTTNDLVYACRLKFETGSIK